MKNLMRGILVIAMMAGVLSAGLQAASQAPAAGQTAAPAAAPDTTQTADQIVAKYVEAIGGKAAISQVKSISTESSVTVMGSENPSTTTILDGVGFKSETEFNGQKIVQCYTDKGGWTINPMAGSADATALPDDQYKARKGDIYVGGPLYDYAAKGSKVELFGKVGNAFKIKLTTKDDVESFYLIDGTSYLLTSIVMKGNMQGQEVEITTKVSDYRKTEVGMLVPYAIDVDLGGQFSLNVVVKKVELNKTIDPAIFEMPKKS